PRELLSPARPGVDFSHYYSHPQAAAIRAGRLIFCSGMLPIDAETGQRMHGTLTSEAHVIFKNLKLLLESAGSSLDRLVQVHALVYYSIEDDGVKRVYRGGFCKRPPGRTGWGP